MSRVVGGVAPSQADLEASDRVRELQATELERVRERAARWRDGLVALTALFGAVVFVKGGGAVTAQPPWSRWLIGVATAVALISVLAASFLSMLAAFGWASSPAPVGAAVGLHERLLRENRRRVRRAITQLKSAAALMIFGVTAMAVAAGAGVFVPSEAAKNSGSCIRVPTTAGAVATISARPGQTVRVDGAHAIEVGPC